MWPKKKKKKGREGNREESKLEDCILTVAYASVPFELLLEFQQLESGNKFGAIVQIYI